MQCVRAQSVEWLIIVKRMIVVGGADLCKNINRYFSSVKCAFLFHVQGILSLLIGKNGDSAPLVVDVPRERDTLRKKSWKSSRICTKKSYNNNGKPKKSSRILRLKSKSLIFLYFSVFFIMFHCFHFFFSFVFHFFLFRFFSVVRADTKTGK